MLTEKGDQYLQRYGKDIKGGFNSQLAAELDATPRKIQTDRSHTSVGNQ
jgi:hypothetical protein